jgi:hypothetical protein
MAKKGAPHVHFTIFMANNTYANWIAVWKMYGFGDFAMPMEDWEKIHLLHWAINLEKITHAILLVSTQTALYRIQGYQVPCDPRLVVIIWNYYQRRHVWTLKVAQILTLSL